MPVVVLNCTELELEQLSLYSTEKKGSSTAVKVSFTFHYDEAVSQNGNLNAQILK